ncbi:MAG: hypothetical protein M3245_02270 [Actinomycetota bacterium]|nr:hypothetical protein [Actinomycetota bacterium]
MSARLRPAVIVLAALLWVPAGTGFAGPDEPLHGLTSASVEHVRYVPFEVGTATGARIVGDYLYLTSWKNISIYNISNPTDPQLESITPIGFQFESEDAPTNGKILLFSESLPRSALHVWDVRNKKAPVEIATLSGAGNHTTTCILDCTWAYGSSGYITDLRDPATPKEAGRWTAGTGVNGGHDVREVAPGIVLVASGQGALLDARENPAKPTLLATMNRPSGTPSAGHSITWPNLGTDRFILGGSETNATGRCGTSNGATTTWDTRGWQQTGKFEFVDVWRAKSGTTMNGSPPANGLGCSAHWVEEHPAFRDGGLFAQGYYEHGTKIFHVNGAGKLREAGWFLPNGGSTSAVYWASDRLLYAIDYTRGIDILRWNGPIPARASDETNGVTDLAASASGSSVSVSGRALFAGEAPVVMADDVAGDAPISPEHSSDLGADLLQARISRPDAGYPEVVFEWKAAELPALETGIVPEVIRYVVTFNANDSMFRVQAKFSNVASTTAPGDPGGQATEMSRAFQLHGNCETLVVISGNCQLLAWLDGSVDPASGIVRVRVPLDLAAAPQLRPGSVITPPATPANTIFAAYTVGVTTFAPVSTADVADWAEEFSYRIPAGGTVSIGMATPGTDPASVAYSTPAALAENGSFSASLPAGGTGAREVFARACFGTTCSVASTTVTLG